MAWTPDADLVIAMVRDKDTITQTLRGGELVDERPAVKGVTRLVVLPSGAQLSLANNAKGMLVDGNGRARSAHVKAPAIEELAVVHGVAYAAGPSRGLWRFDEATATWAELGLREALKKVLPERDDTDDVHSVVAGPAGPIVGVFANDYHSTLVMEWNGAAWTKRGVVTGANAITWSPEGDTVYGAGATLTALAGGRLRELARPDEDVWSAAWVRGAGLLVGTLADVARVDAVGGQTMVLLARETGGEVPHNHSLIADGEHAAYVCAGKVWTWTGAAFALVFGEPLPDPAVRAAELVAKAVKGKTVIDTLSITDKKLCAFPAAITGFRDLRKLALPMNDIPVLPEAIGDLDKLEVLDLSYNHLLTLPASIGRLQRLKKLNLHLNAIDRLPDEIGDLAALEELDLGMNASLQTTEAGGKPLTQVPEAIGRLANLRVLNLSTNELTELPESLAALQKLETLHLHQNLFATFPRVLLRLPLRTLSIGYQSRPTKGGGPARKGGGTNAAPKSLALIGKLTTLTSLALDRLDMTSLPGSIGDLVNLEELDLSFNKLTTLPVSFWKLTKLRRLNLGNNPLIASTKIVLKMRLQGCSITF